MTKVSKPYGYMGQNRNLDIKRWLFFIIIEQKVIALH